jgi:arsenate reductase
MEKEIIVYHNPRCSKSREAIAILEDSGKKFSVKEYLKETPSLAEIKDLISLLAINPIDLIRKNEDEYKSLIKDKNLNDDQLLLILSENPKLIERPIVITNNKAVIGRPPSLIIDLIK